MSVIDDSLEFHWAGSTGSIDRDGPVEYTALWKLQVDDPLDQVQVILIWWQLNQFRLGFPYQYANDAFGSLATAQNISADRMLETVDWWVVKVKFSRESDDSKQDQGDSHTTDPLEYRPIIRCSSNAVSQPAQLLKYIEGYQNRMSNILLNRQIAEDSGKTMPVNSADVPFDPLPQINSYHWYISVEQNLASFDANLAFVGFTNSLSLRFDYKGFTRGPVAPDQCRIRDCEIELTRENTVDFWKVRYYIEVKPDGEDFKHRIIDRGLSAVAIAGRPDMHGGTFAPGNQNTPVPEVIKRAPVVGIIDAHELPLREPVLFNGDGEALPPETEAIVVGIWDEDKKTDFNVLPVIKEIIGDLLP